MTKLNRLRLCAALATLTGTITALSAQAEIAQKGNLRVSVSGKLAPKKLPRKGTAPIAVSVGGEISTTDASLPPQLKTLRIELNRNGRLDYTGLPTCKYGRIQPGSSSRALANCRSALVGKGSFTANITLADQGNVDDRLCVESWDPRCCRCGGCRPPPTYLLRSPGPLVPPRTAPATLGRRERSGLARL